MKKLLSAILPVVTLLAVSCDKSDEPSVDVPNYRIEYISSDEDYQFFNYDGNGRISDWILYEPKKDIIACETHYEYDEDEGLVLISSDENMGSERWVFEESLDLGHDGIAKTAVGKVEIFNSDGSALMKKKYTAEFQYDSQKQLTCILISEKRFNDSGWEENNPLRWKVQMKWEKGNMVEYCEQNASGTPMATKIYSYYLGMNISYYPMSGYPILRSYYTPLQYQGVLGHISSDLIKSVHYTSRSDAYTRNFTYNISTTSTYSMVDSYTMTMENTEFKYTVGWEKF